MEEEFVTKSKNVSAGRLRERFVDRDVMKLVRVVRHVEGKARSVGTIGEYHHLFHYQHLRGWAYGNTDLT